MCNGSRGGSKVERPKGASVSGFESVSVDSTSWDQRGDVCVLLVSDAVVVSDGSGGSCGYGVDVD